MGKMLVFTNPVEGREDDFNEWYNEVHLKEVTATAPFTGGQRFRVSPVNGVPQGDHRYLAIYEFDGPPQAALDNMTAAAPTLNMSDALSPDALVVFIEEI
jgi:hypothetical protein